MTVSDAMLERAVRHYLRHASAREDEDSWWRADGSLDGAVSRAALCQIRGKRHDHQRRLRHNQLVALADRLTSPTTLPKVRACADFEAIHDLVRAESRGIWKDARLTVYDVADRIGLFLGHEPQVVHLHSGTGRGAAAAGMIRKRGGPHWLTRSELRLPLRELSCRDVENLLCIYKPVFTGEAPFPADDQRGCGRRKLKGGGC